MTKLTPRFLNAGEAALVVEFGSTVDPVTNDHVIALDESLATLALPGILETVPTYRSLMIHYDPLVLDRASLVAKISALQVSSQDATKRQRSLWTIPCCYEPPFGEDLRDIAEMAQITQANAIALHSGASFRAYMYGFAPGFCYLGGVPKELGISRRPMPRSHHAPNSILVAGGLCLIGTFSMPTGWWVIGRTPVRMFSLLRDPNFLVEVGDTIRFRPVGKDEFDFLDQRELSGEVVAVRETIP